jgi:hypothetical protein
MSEQDKNDIQNAKQFVLAAIDSIFASPRNQLAEGEKTKVFNWCADAVKLLDNVEERNP